MIQARREGDIVSPEALESDMLPQERDRGKGGGMGRDAIRSQRMLTDEEIDRFGRFHGHVCPCLSTRIPAP